MASPCLRGLVAAGLLLASNAAVLHAQDAGYDPGDSGTEVSAPDGSDMGNPAPTPDAAAPQQALYLTVTAPATEYVHLPASATTLSVEGSTLPDAAVSIDGDLVDVDDHGNFSTVVALDDDVEIISVLASSADGSQVESDLYVDRTP